MVSGKIKGCENTFLVSLEKFKSVIESPWKFNNLQIFIFSKRVS